MSSAEKFIIDSTKNYSNEKRITIGKLSHWEKQPWLTPDEALRAVEIAREEIYEWLLSNADDYCFCAKNFEARRCIYDIKQAMKDE